MEFGEANFSWRQPPFEYEWQKLPIDILSGIDGIRLKLESGEPIGAIDDYCAEDAARFGRLRQEYLRYPA
jgi:hypothetical protein